MTKEVDLFSVLKKALVLASLISGIFFIIRGLVNPSVTGAIVGGNASNPEIVFGVVLFLLALTISHSHYLSKI